MSKETISIKNIYYKPIGTLIITGISSVFSIGSFFYDDSKLFSTKDKSEFYSTDTIYKKYEKYVVRIVDWFPFISFMLSILLFSIPTQIKQTTEYARGEEYASVAGNKYNIQDTAPKYDGDIFGFIFFGSIVIIMLYLVYLGLLLTNKHNWKRRTTLSLIIMLINILLFFSFVRMLIISFKR